MSLPQTVPDAPSLPVYVTVPPAKDVDLVYGQEVIFQSPQQNWKICFGTCAHWPALSQKSFSDSEVRGTAPSVDADLNYNVVTSGTCTPTPPIGTGRTIHVRSTGLRVVA